MNHLSAWLAFGILLVAARGGRAEDLRDALWAAVRNSDAKGVEAALDRGADVNAANEIGITALWIAAGKGKSEVIELLLKRGADPSVRDLIWYQTPLSSAIGSSDVAVIKALLNAGAKDYEATLLAAAGRAKPEIVDAILNLGKPIRQDVLDAALFGATRATDEIKQALTKAGAKSIDAISDADKKALEPMVGEYESDNGAKVKFEIKDQGLVTRGGPGLILVRSNGPGSFAPLGMDNLRYRFELQDGVVQRMIMNRFTAEYSFFRADAKPAAQPSAVLTDRITTKQITPKNWPAFRGIDASGVADGQHPPLSWDAKTGENIRWKTPIPGLGHSCPVIWNDRVFLTTAISGDPDPKIKTGNYGDVASVDDSTPHAWKVYCLDRDTGKIIWEHTAFEGVPKSKRHLKGSQANCTPATDGRCVVACFGPEGMYCYDFAGKLLWKRDLGNIDSSFAIDREYEWGFAASPVIHDGMVILQCDLSKDSFIAAFSLENGDKVWSTPRDEIPTWSSPMIWRSAGHVELVTNGSQFARGYDPSTGRELWRLAKKSEASIPTPVAGPGVVFVTSGNRPIQPIFAIRPGARGDISFSGDDKPGPSIGWSRLRGGPYMTTPIVYDKCFYTCSNSGILTCYEADTGKEIYKERLGGDTYTASPVAADGRIYFISETGEVRIIKAGPKFELLAAHELGDICLSSPAISAGCLFVRTQHYLWALGK